MKNILLLSITLLSQFISYSQQPEIEWQKIFFTPNDQYQKNKIVTINKENYVVAGQVFTDPDGFGPKPYSWYIEVTKTDLNSNIIWQKFYGGSALQEFESIKETPDRGFVIVGYTLSNDFDVSGNHGSLTSDIWIIKIDSVGNIEWQKCVGGSQSDYGSDVALMQDGSFLVVGTTLSFDFDAANNHGKSSDILVTKISAYGIVQWVKTIGGIGSEEGRVVKKDAFNDYIIGGVTSYSNDGDIKGNHDTTSNDFLIVKLDSNGNIIFSKCYGSTKDDYLYNVGIDPQGGYVLVGSVRGSDGDISGYHQNDDGWIAKVDLQGNLLWQKCIGGSSNDEITDLTITQDNQYLIVGSTYSNDGDITLNKGKHDVFVGKYDHTSDSIFWLKTFGGSDEDLGIAIQYLSDDTYLFTSQTFSGDGDVKGNLSGTIAIWLVEIGNSNTIKGTIFLDANSNGTKDSDEPFTNEATVTITKGNHVQSAIPYLGNFSINIDTGSYKINATSFKPYYNSMPSSIDTSFYNYFNSDSVSFALQPIPGKQDIKISLYSPNGVYVGVGTILEIKYSNVGTKDITNGNIELIKSSKFSIISSVPQYLSMNVDTIKWSYNNLKTFTDSTIFITLGLPVGNASIGDTLRSIVSITPFENDLTPSDDTASITQVVNDSYYHNEKTENNTGSISKSEITNADYLTYTIHFQNMGTDTAFNIIVRDTLDSKLDWNSLEMIDASHNYHLNINDGNKCAWYFNNVLLPDSNINEAASHGYIVYRIKPKTTLVAENVINNTASIYFDYNLPVQTNTEKTVVANDIILPLHLLSFTAQYNGITNLIKWSTAEELNTDRFEIQRSNNSRDFVTISTVSSLNNGKSKNDYTYTDAQPLKAINYYRLKMIDKDGKFTYSAIKNVNNTGSFDVSLYPNPVKNLLTLNFNAEKTMDMQVEIINAEGRKIFTQKMQLSTGASTQKINTASLGAGQYFIKCISADGQMGLKFVKQ